MNPYLPILILIGLALVIAIAMTLVSGLVARILRVNHPSAKKLQPYECGMTPIGGARVRFSIKFYLIAMLFILFDIEVIFLVPWAAVFKTLIGQGPAMRWFAYLEMMIFVGLLLVGYIYVVKKGAFDWGERARREAEAEARALHDLEARRAQPPQRTAA